MSTLKPTTRLLISKERISRHSPGHRGLAAGFMRSARKKEGAVKHRKRAIAEAIYQNERKYVKKMTRAKKPGFNAIPGAKTDWAKRING